MVVVVITCVWFMWLLIIASRAISNLKMKAYKWNSIVSNISGFRKNINLKVLGFLSKILDKGGEKYDKSKSKKTK